MSLLNLNTSAGRGPRGKKSLKMFMGTGLLVAVLGIGSTLAANITINSPEGTSEFGQGVTQTIYCGEAGSATVKVTPASSYANSSSTKTLTNAKFITGTSGYGSTSVNPVTIYGSTSSNLPKFSSYSTSSKIGWWLSSSSTTATPITTQPTFDQVFSSPGSYFFTERNSDGTFKKPASSPSIQEVSIVMSNEISNFKLEKVTISNIPPSCTGVNFVLSSYGADSEAQELSDGASPAIKEVAVLWNGAASTTYPSRSRTTFSDTEEDNECLVTSAQTTTSLTFTFAEPYIPSKDLKKLVIETQEDAIGAGSCS